MARIIGEIEYNGDYFRANLDDGGVRIGLIECSAIDYPRNHKLYKEAVSMQPEEFEMFFDNYYQ